MFSNAKLGFKIAVRSPQLLGLGILFLLGFFFWPLGLLPKSGPCLYAHLLGHPCPGCGMTHAVHAIREGELALALSYNPFVLVLIFSLFLIYLSAWVKWKNPLLLGLDFLYLYANWIIWGLFLR